MITYLLLSVYLLGVAFIAAAAFSYRPLDEWGTGRELSILIAAIFFWPVFVLLRVGFKLYERLTR